MLEWIKTTNKPAISQNNSQAVWLTLWSPAILCYVYTKQYQILPDLPSTKQNQQDFSFSSPRQPAHQLDYLQTFSQTIVHILGICLQRSKHLYQLYKQTHYPESAMPPN